MRHSHKSTFIEGVGCWLTGRFLDNSLGGSWQLELFCFQVGYLRSPWPVCPPKIFLSSDGICPTHGLNIARMNERPIMTNEQLELGLDGAKRVTAPQRREGRVSRAAWWFTQMRRMVGAAIDWEAAPDPRPEQTWLPGTQQRVRI